VETVDTGRRPPVSVIMANRNNARSLDMFFERLERNTAYPDLEIVVVDDESSDASVQILRRWRESGRFRSFTLLEQPHGGVMRALNAALDAAGGEVIAAMDGDATVETPGWLDAMVDLQQSDPRVGVVTGAIELEDGRIQGYGMNVVGPLGAHGRGTVPTEPAGRRSAHELTANPRVAEVRDLMAPAEVDAPLGPCMLYARELAREIGGYDVGYSPVWFDDVDFGVAARRIGLKNFFLPLRVVHWIGARYSRGEASRSHRAAVRARGAAGRLLPAGAKRALWRAAGRDAIPPERWQRLRHHYDYWRGKWGWDFVNPDLDEVRRRWGGTEICWAFDDARRAAGRDVLAHYERLRGPGVRAG
jgi:glycosyltransferase involved in cell wall biosynthesis